MCSQYFSFSLNMVSYFENALMPHEAVEKCEGDKYKVAFKVAAKTAS